MSFSEIPARARFASRYVAAFVLTGVLSHAQSTAPVHISLHPQGTATASTQTPPGTGDVQPSSTSTQPVSSAPATYAPSALYVPSQGGVVLQPGQGGTTPPPATPAYAAPPASVALPAPTSPPPPPAPAGMLTPETAYHGGGIGSVDATTPTHARTANVSHSEPVQSTARHRKVPTVIVQDPKPVLDEHGQQVVDPDGKPMFYPPVMQLRDKHGMPVFDHGKPVFQTKDNLGYDENGKPIRPPRAPATPKNTAITIEHGTFDVDGIVGKLQLDYNIPQLQFLYLYVPEIGVVVVSDKPFPGAQMQRGAFRGRVLSVRADKHILQVSSSQPLLGKKPVSAYVMVDRDYVLPAHFPVIGYGGIRVPPYVWPGSKLDTEAAKVSRQAPPLPRQMKPRLESAPCPAGVVCAENYSRMPTQ